MSLRPLISNIYTSAFWARKRISWDQQHGESLQDFLPYLLWGSTFHTMIAPPQTAQTEGVDLWGKMGVMPRPGQERGHGHLVLLTLRLTQTCSVTREEEKSHSHHLDGHHRGNQLWPSLTFFFNPNKPFCSPGLGLSTSWGWLSFLFTMKMIRASSTPPTAGIISLKDVSEALQSMRHRASI